MGSLRAQIAAGADVNARDRHGQTGLMLAAAHGHLEAVEVLIRAGADPDRTGKFGLSATMLAVVNHHEESALALANAGANLCLTGSGAPGFAGKTAAGLAADADLLSLAERLDPARDET